MNTFRGKTVYSDAQYLHVELEDGRVISTPMEWYEDLQKASPDQLSDYQFICQNTGIEWPGLDYHLSIESMMAAHIVLVPRAAGLGMRGGRLRLAMSQEAAASETGFPSRRASGNQINTEGLSPGDKSPG